MSLFDAPVLRGVTKADFVLRGGRTQLRVAISGWGRLTLSLASPNGAVEQQRLWFYGGERDLVVDVLPPGEVTIDLRNPFGEASTTIPIRADLPGVVALPPPLVRPVAAAAVPPGPVLSPLPVPVVRLPPVRRLGEPRVNLGAISLKTNHASRTQGDWNNE
jgi:hypothetical protein